MPKDDVSSAIGSGSLLCLPEAELSVTVSLKNTAFPVCHQQHNGNVKTNFSPNQLQNNSAMNVQKIVNIEDQY